MTQTLTWNDSFATGVAEIDEQHMILVHTLNEAAIKLAADPSLSNLDQITRDLLSYALYHFETEEELMHQYSYEAASDDAAAQHLEQHRSFSARIVAVRDAIKAGNLMPPGELLAFLNDWLTNHILNTDKQFGAFILARQSR
ncbi:MAG TPA: bacteriohemerythrin [Azonexus sp.]